jgi:chromosome segregation ATPase
MSSDIVGNQTPEELELQRKQAESASLEAELIQRELDLVTLRAELADFESRYLRTVGVLYAELDEIEAQIAEAQSRRKPSDSDAQVRAQPRAGSSPGILRNGQRNSRSETQTDRESKKTVPGSSKAHSPRFGHKRR